MSLRKYIRLNTSLLFSHFVQELQEANSVDVLHASLCVSVQFKYSQCYMVYYMLTQQTEQLGLPTQQVI